MFHFPQPRQLPSTVTSRPKDAKSASDATLGFCGVADHVLGGAGESSVIVRDAGAGIETGTIVPGSPP